MAQYYEDRQAFRRAIEKRLGRSLSDGEWIGVEPTWGPPYGKAEVDDILADLKEQGVQPHPTGPLKVARLKMRLLAEAQAAQAKQKVRDYRLGLFGSPEPPYPDDLKGAGDWIEAEENKQEHARSDSLVGLDGRMPPPGELLGQLEYICEDGEVREVDVFQGTPLAGLWIYSRGTTARRLGWEQHRIVGWILTGSCEPPSPIDYSWTPGGPITLTVRSPDVHADFVKERYQDLRRKAWGEPGRVEGFMEGLEDFRKRDIALIEFVDSRRSRKKISQEWLRADPSPGVEALAGKFAEERWEDWLLDWNRLYRQCGWSIVLVSTMQTYYNRAKQRFPK